MNTYGNYQNAYKRASVNTVDQNKLIIMLYDGAIKNINFALEWMRAGDLEKTHNCLVKSKNIVAELMSSLNLEKGGEIAKNLQGLYSFMFGQLIEANMKKDPKPAVTVRNLLMELREAWVVIGKKTQQPAPSARPQMQQQAMRQNQYSRSGAKRINLRG